MIKSYKINITFIIFSAKHYKKLHLPTKLADSGLPYEVSVVGPFLKRIRKAYPFWIRKVFYPERIDPPTPLKEGSYTFPYHKKRNPNP